VLAFGFQDDPGYLALDDVAVYDLGAGITIQTNQPPQLEAVTLANRTVTFSWSAQLGQTFQVQVTPSLDQPNWTSAGLPFSVTNTIMTVAEPINRNTQQFFRIIQLQN
jgi:hypothetical protein